MTRLLLFALIVALVQAPAPQPTVKAIAAYRRALDVEPAVPTPLYQLGLVYALKQEPDRAFEWLTRARDTHKIDMTQATVAPELEPLKKDARFAALLPTRADFDHPFLEAVRVLREWDGDAARVQLGSGVEAAGDTNKDGIPDVIASAPNGGYARVYSGRDGRVILTLRAEHADDAFGVHAAGVGDVDRDGHADFIVGAWQYSGAAVSGGRAYLYSGRDGRLMKTFTCRTPGDAFGFDSIALGDVDGDGTVDFLITSAWSGVSATPNSQSIPNLQLPESNHQLQGAIANAQPATSNAAHDRVR